MKNQLSDSWGMCYIFLVNFKLSIKEKKYCSFFFAFEYFFMYYFLGKQKSLMDFEPFAMDFNRRAWIYCHAPLLWNSIAECILVNTMNNILALRVTSWHSLHLIPKRSSHTKQDVCLKLSLAYSMFKSMPRCCLGAWELIKCSCKWEPAAAELVLQPYLVGCYSSSICVLHRC